jgi:uncharacterized protein (DUF1330 family)
MPAYLIVDATITDPSKLDEYMAAVGPSLAGREFKVLALSTDTEVLEGDAGERTVLMEFPDREALHAWYDSPEYTNAKQFRLAGTDGIGVIVDGL